MPKATKKKAAKKEESKIAVNRGETVVAAACIYAWLRYGVNPTNMERNDMHETAIQQAMELQLTFDTLGQELLQKAVDRVNSLQSQREAGKE